MAEPKSLKDLLTDVVKKQKKTLEIQDKSVKKLKHLETKAQIKP